MVRIPAPGTLFTGLVGLVHRGRRFLRRLARIGFGQFLGFLDLLRGLLFPFTTFVAFAQRWIGQTTISPSCTWTFLVPSAVTAVASPGAVTFPVVPFSAGPGLCGPAAASWC